MRSRAHRVRATVTYEIEDIVHVYPDQTVEDAIRDDIEHGYIVPDYSKAQVEVEFSEEVNR